MTDYDKPKTPEDTPAPIDPDAKPKPASEMEAEGEREGEVLKGQTAPDDIAVERAMSAAQDGGRDGQGENALDTMKSETILPPD